MKLLAIHEDSRGVGYLVLDVAGGSEGEDGHGEDGEEVEDEDGEDRSGQLVLEAERENVSSEIKEMTNLAM